MCQWRESYCLRLRLYQINEEKDGEKNKSSGDYVGKNRQLNGTNKFARPFSKNTVVHFLGVFNSFGSGP